MKFRSLYTEFAILALTALFVSLIFYFATEEFVNDRLTDYLESEEVLTEQNNKARDEFQKYVTENHLTTDDTAQISQWVLKNDADNLQIYKDGELYFDSSYPTQKEWNNNPEIGYYDWMEEKTVTFADQKAQVAVYTPTDLQIYDTVDNVILAVSCGLYLVVVIGGIRRKIRYIGILRKEMKVMEGGVLEGSIPVKGHDELSELAQGMDAMRQAFRTELETREKLEADKRTYTTKLSHDLRTPLTNIILYTEILQQEIYQTEEEKQEAFEQIHNSSEKMKKLADELLQNLLTK